MIGIHDGDAGERTAFCPSDDDIAAYFDGAAKPGEKEQLGQHLALCIFCRSRLGMLSRLASEDDDILLDGGLLAKAKQLGTNPGGSRAVWVAWPSAAALLLAVGVFVSIERYSAGSDVAITPATAHSEAQGDDIVVRQLRSMESDSPRPMVLDPVANASVLPGKLTVRWTPVPGALFYDVLLLSDAGELLLRERVEETLWQPAGAAGVPGNGRYFLRVKAFLADGRSSGSEHVAFSVTSAEEDGS